jgi:hypothetical protein
MRRRWEELSECSSGHGGLSRTISVRIEQCKMDNGRKLLAYFVEAGLILEMRVIQKKLLQRGVYLRRCMQTPMLGKQRKQTRPVGINVGRTRDLTKMKALRRLWHAARMSGLLHPSKFAVRTAIHKRRPKQGPRGTRHCKVGHVSPLARVDLASRSQSTTFQSNATTAPANCAP